MLCVCFVLSTLSITRDRASSEADACGYASGLTAWSPAVAGYCIRGQPLRLHTPVDSGRFRRGSGRAVIYARHVSVLLSMCGDLRLLEGTCVTSKIQRILLSACARLPRILVVRSYMQLCRLALYRNGSHMLVCVCPFVLFSNA